MNELGPFLIPLAFALIFWLVLVRPARRQQARTAQVQRDLQPGDRVLLSSGIFGTLRETAEDRVRLEVAPGTVLEVARQAVVRQDQPAAGSGRNENDTAPGEHMGTRHADTES